MYFRFTAASPSMNSMLQARSTPSPHFPNSKKRLIKFIYLFVVFFLFKYFLNNWDLWLRQFCEIFMYIIAFYFSVFILVIGVSSANNTMSGNSVTVTTIPSRVTPEPDLGIITVPPRPQKVIHSDIYLKYVFFYMFYI